MYIHGGEIYDKKIELDFSTNLNVFGMPQKVIDAAIEGIYTSDQYPDPHCHTLRQAISDKYQIEKNDIYCGNGAAELIYSVVQTLRPQKAILLTPSFHEYEQALLSVNCSIQYIQMKEAEEFQLSEVDSFLEKLTSKIDMLFLCNPNNPTGHLLNKDFLEKILKRGKENGIFVVVDECFLEFTSDCDEVTQVKNIKSYDNLFVLKAFTKTYAMAGLRLGFGFTTNSRIRKELLLNRQPWNVSVPAQLAGIAAMKEDRYLKESISYINKAKDIFIKNLRRLNYKVLGSKANYVFFKGEEDLFDFCLENKILIRDCSNYRGVPKGYVRVSVKKIEENQQLIDTLERRSVCQNQL